MRRQIQQMIIRAASGAVGSVAKAEMRSHLSDLSGVS